MVTKGLLHNNKRIFISRTGMRILLNGGGDGNSAEGVVHKRNGEHGRLLRVQSKGSRSNSKATCAGVSYCGGTKGNHVRKGAWMLTDTCWLPMAKLAASGPDKV